MDSPFATFIERRKARYTAQALEVFETSLEAPLRLRGLMADPEIAQGVEAAKAAVRARLRDLAVDAYETMPIAELTFVDNAAARDLSDLRQSGADSKGATA